MTHCDYVRFFCGTDLDLLSCAGAEPTPAGGGSIRGFGSEGHDVNASKLDAVTAQDAIKAVGNNQHSLICDGDLNSDLAAAFEQVAGPAVSNVLAGRYTRIRKPEPHGQSLFPRTEPALR